VSVKIGVMLVFTLAACGKLPYTRPAQVSPQECVVLPAPKKSADTIMVAMFDAVEPDYAPWAHNAGEQLLFHHLYENLITVDCLGQLRAGLAASWKGAKRGRRWSFTLHEGARFWDGTPVTARDVARSWRDALTLDTVIDSTAVDGERILHVYLKERHRHVPRVISAPAFAVAKPTGDSRWPLGSGRYGIVPSLGGLFRTSRRVITARPAFDGKGPVIQFIEASAYDARDLLRGGVDVMMTTDPAVIEYASGRPQLTTVALPWNQSYVLLSISRVEALRMGVEVGTISHDLTDGVARDAVRADARGYRPPSWWDDLRSCHRSASVQHQEPTPRGAYASSSLRRVLYDINDAIARDLAERVVALAALDPAASADAAAIASAVPGLTGGASVVITEGVTGRELNSSLRYGDDFAFVVPLPRRPPDPCHALRELIERAPWLVTAGVDLSEALIPLVDTRPHVIARKDRFGLVVDWYGNIRVMRPGLHGGNVP
jgi:hypothetical protein